MVRNKKKKKVGRDFPYISAAMICEKILTEDKVVSAIRIIDTVTLHTVPTLTEGSEGVEFPFTLYVGFRTGKARGKYPLELRWIMPSGKTIPAAKTDVEFSPPAHGGRNVMLPVKLRWEGVGLYWYEILLEGKLVSRIPLMVALSPNKEQAKK